MDSMATLTEEESVFEPLSVGDKSLKIVWKILLESKSRLYQGRELTTRKFLYPYVGVPDEVHYHV